MRTFRRICNEADTASMSAKMRRAARARLDQVNSEYQRATRVVERLLQAHEGEYRGDQKRRSDFRMGRAPAPRCEDPVPMERRPTLPVNEVLEAERRELSWDNMAAPGGWSQPSMADRGRGVGDLGMAGLNIGAPARLQAEYSRRPMPARRWEGIQGSCPARAPAPRLGQATDSGSSWTPRIVTRMSSSDEPEQGRTEGLRLSTSKTRLSMRQRCGGSGFYMIFIFHYMV